MIATGLFRTLSLAACLVCLAGVSAPAAGQETQEDIKRELAAMRAEIQQLRAEVNALKGVPGAQGAQVELLQTQIAELAQVKVESTSRMPVKIFGTIHANVFANSGTPNWLENPNLVAAPPADGRQGTFSATLRQTRIGLSMAGPTVGSARASANVAMDFFGGIPGFQTGQVMGLPRLLVAIARHVRVSGGIVAPIAGDLAVEDYRFVPPALSGERSRRPGVQAHVAFGAPALEARRFVSAGLSGHYGWEQRPGELAESWAAAFDFGLRRDHVGLAGEAFVGENIDAFGGALGLDARAAGGWAELQLFAGDNVSFNAGAGVDQVTDDRRAMLVRRLNRTGYGNLIFSLTPEVQASFEYRWLETTPGTGSERRNHHFDWVLAYKF
jgi:hypothetical protein